MSETRLKQNFFKRNIKLLYFHILKLITPLCIVMSPEMMSWLTHFNTNYRRLPATKDRIFMKENPLDEFIFYSELETKFNEVNIVLRGNNLENINTNLPTFFINTYKPKTSFPNRIYATSDRLMFKAMMGEPVNEFVERFNYEDPEKIFYHFMALGPLLESQDLNKKNIKKNELMSKLENTKKILNYKRDYVLSVCSHNLKGHNIQIGSGILAVISLLHLSKKVNVYGWDSFLEGNFPKSYFKQSLKLWSNFSDFQPLSRFSAIALNWIYAHRLINYFSSERLIVHGKINEIVRLKWVEKYLYRFIYHNR